MHNSHVNKEAQENKHLRRVSLERGPEVALSGMQVCLEDKVLDEVHVEQPHKVNERSVDNRGAHKHVLRKRWIADVLLDPYPGAG